MDVNTFKVRLAGLPFLSKSEIQSYQQRVTQGRVDPQTLYREALAVHKNRRNQEIYKKRRELERRIANLPLNEDDLYNLLNIVNDKSNLDDLHDRAKKIVELRKKKDLGKRRAKLSNNLGKIQINQSNKTEILKKFNEGKNTIRTLIENAKKLEKKKTSERISKQRKILRESIKDLGISQSNQLKILQKFKTGKSGVKNLIEEAKKMKTVKVLKGIAGKRAELTELATKLGVIQNFAKRIKAVNTNDKADALKDVIEKAGEKKRLTELSNEKDKLVKLAREMGIYDSFAGMISGATTVQSLNVVKLDIVQASKIALSKLSNEKNVSSNFSRAISNLRFSNRLIPLKKRIEEAGGQKTQSKKREAADILARNKENFIDFVRKSAIPDNKRRVFINRMRLDDVNIPKLREDVATMEKNVKNTKRNKELNELLAYIKNLNIDKPGFISKFKTTNVPLKNIKNEINDIVKNQANTQVKKNELVKKAKRISYELNITGVKNKNNINVTNEKLSDAYKKKLQNNKKILSNFALQANIDILNNLSAINDLNKLNNAKVVIKKRTKDKLRKIAESTGTNQVLLAKINTVNTPEDVKNLTKRMKSVINTQIKNMKVSEKKEKEKENRRRRENMRREQEQISKNKEDAYQKEKALMIEKKKLERNAMVEEQKMIGHQLDMNEIIEYLNELGIEPKDHQYFINQYTTYNKPVNVIKKDANKYYMKLYREYRNKNLPKLVTNLKKLELNQSNIDYIINKYIKTYIESPILLTEAKGIANIRKAEKGIRNDENFAGYVSRLTLKQENRDRIALALDAYFVNFEPLIKSATNSHIKTVNNPRATQRKELENYINTRGLSRVNKLKVMKNFNAGVGNVNAMKSVIANIHNMRNAKKNIKIKAKLNKEASNKVALNQKNETNKLNIQRLENAEEQMKRANNKLKKNQKIQFRRYIVNLGLNASNERVKKLIDNYNKFPNDVQQYQSKAESIKSLDDERVRLLNRTKALPVDEVRNKRIKNIKNLDDVKRMDKNITRGYVDIIRKEISNITLKSRLEFNLNLGKITTVNQAERVRNRLVNAITRKKSMDMMKLQEAIKPMTAENQNMILQKFTSQNIPINKMLKRVTELKNKRADEKYKAERASLYTFLDKELNMNVEDRKSILKDFDEVKTLSVMKTKATQLKDKRIRDKIATDRNKIQKILQPLNLSNTDKTAILKNFNTTPGSVILFETKARNIKKKRNDEKRANERSQLVKHMNTLQLSETNTKKILNTFDGTKNKTLTISRLNATDLKKQRNREKLVETMKTLILTNAVKTNILKAFRNNPNRVNTLITRAKQIDSKARSQENLQKETREYIVSLQLGNKNTPILQKINNSLTLNKAQTLRKQAEKIKTEINAEALEKKRSNIRNFANDIQITAGMKRTFIDSVTPTTNIDALKRKIQVAERALKNKKSTRGRLKTELRVYLNTLNLTKEQKDRLEGNVGNNTKNITALKKKAKYIVEAKKTNIIETEMREAKARKNNMTMNARKREQQIKMVKSAKAFKADQNKKERMKSKPRLEKHLYSLVNVPQKRIDEYLENYINGKKTIQQITTISSAKDKQFAKTKKRIAILIPKLPMKKEMKNTFNKRLKTKRVDIDELKTNIKNTIVKQMIPAKEKKNLINQLLAKE
tara:strand:+ start:13304 stop:18262 length:4959 start_codon:yes stop_codon:yes gene_type:complete